MFRSTWTAALASVALLMLAHLAAPAPAHACGGTFCDTAAGSMPVDQTGETIVFAQGGGFVEAHVEINYDGGDATQFSWIVPVPEVPEISVGSLDFIETLRNSTVPTYGLATGTNECNGGGSGLSDGFIATPDGGGVNVDDPEVLELSTVGAFDFVVLQGGTSDTIMQWLEDNGYAPSPLAPSILDAYIDEGSVFVAFRLRHVAGIEDLHPVVIRYEGTEPCIPLRLTAVAAQDDMDIRAMFLGEARMLPTNYRHVRLNDLQLDWLRRAPEYATAVSRAMDEAGGRAFVTEYAGSSDIVDPAPLDNTLLDPDDFVGIDPVAVVNVLVSQGLVQCSDNCSYRHELVPLLLREFFPAPKGVDPDTLYACLSCYERLLDLSAWDEAAFIERYREYILDPRLHALDLLDTWPYLTRLYTRMSASEMAFDPMFAETPGLGPVPNMLGAQRNTDACCDDTMVLPDGANVRIGADGNWPTWPEDMPYAARIQQYQPMGPPADVVDNVDAINAMLADHNAEIAAAAMCDGPGASGSSSGDTPEPPDTSTTGAAPPDPGTTGNGGSSTSSSGSGQGGGGGCRVGGEPTWFALLAVVSVCGIRRRSTWL